MAFKVFRYYGAASRDAVTLRVSGHFFVPDMMIKKSGCVRAEFARLHYDDKNKNIIAIELLDEGRESDDSVKRVSLEKSGVSVNALSFLRFLGLKRPKRKCILEVKRERGLLVIDLTDKSHNLKD